MKNKTNKTEKAKQIAKDIVETLQYGEAEAKARKQIRKRSSYGYFEKIYKNLPVKISRENKALILLQIWKILDDNKGFHYRKTSFYALESIGQMLEDKHIKYKHLQIA
jgi:pantothenate kinase